MAGDEEVVKEQPCVSDEELCPHCAMLEEGFAMFAGVVESGREAVYK